MVYKLCAEKIKAVFQRSKLGLARGTTDMTYPVYDLTQEIGGVEDELSSNEPCAP